MKTFSMICFTMALGFIVTPARAGTGFDFTQCATSSNFYGNSQTESSACGSAGYSNVSGAFSETIGTGVNAIQVTITAYTTGTGAGDTNTVGTAISSGTNAVVGQYGGNGLGICSIGDSGYSTSSSSSGCGSPYHQVDDNSSYEFLLLTFSSAVNLSSVSLANFGGLSSQTQTQQLDALGFTYWANPSSLSTIVAGGITVLCGTSGAAACPTAEGSGTGIGAAKGSWTSGFGTNGQGTLSGVTTLLIGGDINETDDFFKLQGITASLATPEPGTLGMLGLALAGLGIFNRRKARG